MKKGFTLIELLVVIAIIAILAAILFPVFAQAREKARQTSCLSNCKQIGTAIQLYTDDYDETLPMIIIEKVDNTTVDQTQPCGRFIFNTWGLGDGNWHKTWMDCIFPYVKNLNMYCCPSNTNKQNIGRKPDYVAGYAVNCNISAYANFTETKAHAKEAIPSVCMSQIANASDFVFCCDAASTPSGSWNFNVLISGPALFWWAETNVTGNNRPIRHNGGANFTMCDGHAKYFKKGWNNPTVNCAQGNWGDSTEAKAYWMPAGK